MRVALPSEERKNNGIRTNNNKNNIFITSRQFYDKIYTVYELQLTDMGITTSTRYAA